MKVHKKVRQKTFNKPDTAVKPPLSPPSQKQEELKKELMSRVTKKSPKYVKYSVMSEDIQAVYDFFRGLPSHVEQVAQDYDTYNNECQDIIHGTEFGWIGGHKKACVTALETSRINRRTAKNRQEILDEVMRFMETYPDLVKDLSDLLGWVRRKEAQQAMRGYAPRTEILDKIIGRKTTDDN